MNLLRRFACMAGFHDLIYVGRGWRVCRHCHDDLRIGEVELNGMRSAAWFCIGKIESVGTPEEIATFRAALAALAGGAA